MKLHTAVVLLLAVAVAAFAALNWNTFISPTELSLGVTAVRASLGLVMLGLVAALAIIFLAFAVSLQAAALKESRRQAAELRAAQELAEKAEASRYTRLHKFLEGELARQARLIEENQAAALTRVERLELELRTLIEQSGNTLAAYFGEYEDRLEKTLPESPGENT
ncbi:MAG: hypothetical protein P9M08_09940 [Candidatus Erginobacter occultus]|nr:hypothetical protein [Candidatus Erginobacter occultus]